jgi:hypothetical protein
MIKDSTTTKVVTQELAAMLLSELEAAPPIPSQPPLPLRAKVILVIDVLPNIGPGE